MVNNMTYSELEKKINDFLEKNLIILTKLSEEELASALIEYLASSKKDSWQQKSAGDKILR